MLSAWRSDLCLMPTQTRVQTVGDTQLVRTVSWYDNEMSYVMQLVRTVHYFAKLIKK
jgi:glyceraldehyde 3-phosphate dehydrogenase